MTQQATPSAPEERPESSTPRSRRGEGWALAVGVLILLGLFGHLLNQQRAARQAAAESVRSAPAQPAIEAKTQTASQSRTPQINADTSTPSQVAYAVTHKHRLRDCHGTLTFTREGLRFESDNPQDSFAVRRDDVAIEGDTLRVLAKTWRFEFADAVSAARIFEDWKSGNLRRAPPRSPESQ